MYADHLLREPDSGSVNTVTKHHCFLLFFFIIVFLLPSEPSFFLSFSHVRGKDIDANLHTLYACQIGPKTILNQQPPDTVVVNVMLKECK